VNERWVCKRCFADNDDASGACARCGLARGAEASEADRVVWAAQAGLPAAGQEPGWKRWTRFWWIPVVAVVLVVGYLSTARRGEDGSVTGGGQLSVIDLRVGDCFNAGDEAEISDVDAVPCGEPHRYEAYVVTDHAAGTYPTQSEWETVFVSRCVEAFEPYVGSAYETSAIYASMMWPTEDGWAAGDREIVCYLFEPLEGSLTDTVELTSSLRGAAR
jgi:hypothetical protein